jgi:hypothetical protein
MQSCHAGRNEASYFAYMRVFAVSLLGMTACLVASLASTGLGER